MVSLAIVAAFVLLMILSGAGIVAKDWAREIGVNYAPPTFVGPDAAPAAPRRPRAPQARQAAGRRSTDATHRRAQRRATSKRSSIRSPT